MLLWSVPVVVWVLLPSYGCKIPPKLFDHALGTAIVVFLVSYFQNCSWVWMLVNAVIAFFLTFGLRAAGYMIMDQRLSGYWTHKDVGFYAALFGVPLILMLFGLMPARREP
jgi:hypothetical protein